MVSDSYPRPEVPSLFRADSGAGRMRNHLMTADGSCDRVAVAALIVPAVLFPAAASAVQVGCFVTAVFLGIMFLVGLGLTAVSKHLLAKHVWKVPKTPWL